MSTVNQPLSVAPARQISGGIGHDIVIGGSGTDTVSETTDLFVSVVHTGWKSRAWQPALAKCPL